MMAAITEREREVRSAGRRVGSAVRRLAPRLVAPSALLRLLGGGWALEAAKRIGLKREPAGGDIGV